MKRLIIFGGKTAGEIEAVVREVYPDCFDSVDTCFVGADFSESAVRHLIQKTDSINYILGMKDPVPRQKARLLAESCGMVPFSVIHPTAYIAAGATVGVGCFLAPLSVLGHKVKLGDHCLVHFHASVGHDAVIGANCWVLPGARVSGNVQIGEGVLIGSNAFVFQGISIGDHVSIDAMTYVRNDVPSGRVVSGRRGKLEASSEVNTEEP